MPPDFAHLLSQAGFALPHGLRNAPGETLEEKARKQYAALDAMVTEKLAEAKTLGKPAVFLFGETHMDNGNLLTELMLLDIAEKHGIKKLGLELDAERLAEFRLRYESKIETEYHVGETVAAAEARKMKLIIADTAYPDAKELTPAINTAREQRMLMHLSMENEPVIMIVGGAHLRGLMRQQAKEDPGKTYIPVDLTNLHAAEMIQGGLPQYNVDEIIAMRRDGEIIHSVIGAETRYMDKHQALALAARITGNEKLLELAPSSKPKAPVPNTAFDADKQNFQELHTQMSRRSRFNTGVDYKEQQEEIVRTQHLEPVVQALDADPLIRETYRKRETAGDVFLKLLNDQRPEAKAELADTEKLRQTLEKQTREQIEQKAGQMGVTDPKALFALENVFMYHRQDEFVAGNRDRERKDHRQRTQTPEMKRVSATWERDLDLRQSYLTFQQASDAINDRMRDADGATLRSLRDESEALDKGFEQEIAKRLAPHGITDPASVHAMRQIFEATRRKESHAFNAIRDQEDMRKETATLLENARTIYGDEATTNPVVKELALADAAHTRKDAKMALEHLKEAMELLPQYVPERDTDLKKLNDELDHATRKHDLILNGAPIKPLRDMSPIVDLSVPGYAPEPVLLEQLVHPSAPQKTAPKKIVPKR